MELCLDHNAALARMTISCGGGSERRSQAVSMIWEPYRKGCGHLTDSFEGALLESLGFGHGEAQLDSSCLSTTMYNYKNKGTWKKRC